MNCQRNATLLCPHWWAYHIHKDILHIWKLSCLSWSLLRHFLSFTEFVSELLKDKFLDNKLATSKPLRGSLFKDPTCNKHFMWLQTLRGSVWTVSCKLYIISIASFYNISRFMRHLRFLLDLCLLPFTGLLLAHRVPGVWGCQILRKSEHVGGRLSVLGSGHLYSPGNLSGTNFC